MAITIRQKQPYISGTITNNPLAIGGTSLSSAELANLEAIASPSISVLVLDPLGSAGDPEIVWVTAHTGSATTATISRSQEGSTARQHASGVPWVHAPTTLDFLPDHATGDAYGLVQLNPTEDGYQWGAHQQVARSTSQLTVNASETLANVVGLAFAIPASQVWGFEIFAKALIGATPDIKVAFTAPAGAAITGLATRLDAAGLANVLVTDYLTAVALTTAAAGVGLRLSGVVVNSTAAGTVQLQAAQNTSTAEDTIIYTNSSLRAWRIA